MSDSGEHGRRGDDAALPLLAHRLTALEHRVDTGFNQLDHRLDTLSFVRSDVFAERNAALRAELEVMKADIEASAKPGKWALALFAATLLASVLGVIMQVAFKVAG